MKRATILTSLAAAAIAGVLALAPAAAFGAPNASTPETSQPSASTATVEAALSEDEKVLELSASGRGVEDAPRVAFRIWPDSLGKEKAISYEAVRGEDGAWRATAFIAGNPAGSAAVPYSCDVAGAVHRLYNPWTGAHLFTSRVDEANELIGYGWRYEGVAWIGSDVEEFAPEDPDAPAEGDEAGKAAKAMDAEAEAEAEDAPEADADPAEPGDPSSPDDPADPSAPDDPADPEPEPEPEEPVPSNAVFRLYNQWSGEHLYTADADEYAELREIGWEQEDVAFLSDPEHGQAVYRLFNPYEEVNTHHFTADAEERDELVAAGWVDEGAKWYGASLNADGTWSTLAGGKTFAEPGDYEVEAIVLPERPVAPEEPETPAEPDVPTNPTTPDAPEADAPEGEAPEAPEPADPSTPGAPAESTDPSTPGAPTEPEPDPEPEPVGTATFFVTTPTGSAHVEHIDNAHGRFDIVVDEISSPSGVSRVQVPTWTRANNQADLVWYPAEDEGNGSYRAHADITRHYFDGNLMCHSYVTAGNGVMACVNEQPVTLSLANFLKIEGGPYTYRVSIFNPGPVSSVQMPTWSDAGWQDDLVWYDAKDQGNGWWTATIDTQNLRHDGTVHTHVYADGELRNALDFSVASWELASPEQRAMVDRVMSLSSPTSYLLAVDTRNCFVGVYRGSYGNWSNLYYWSCAPGAAATPTVKGIFHVGSRGYAFGHGYTCYYWTQFYGDYLFHSVKYWPGTFNIQDGTLGSPKSLGCVRLAIQNAKWIYDNIPTGTTVLVY